MVSHLIGEDTKILYIAIPKTASATIYKSLSDKESDPIHDSYLRMLPRIKEHGIDPKGLFVFCSCRNPFSRFKSWAYDVDNRSYRNFGFSWVEEGMSLDDLVYYVWNNTTTGDDGCTLVKDSPEKQKLGNHFQTQYSFIVNEHGDHSLSNFIRFENIEEDYKTVARTIKLRLGIDVPPLGYPERKGGRTTLTIENRPELSVKSKKMLIQIYEKDFDTFGYEKKCN